jgi:LPS-assembly protein
MFRFSLILFTVLGFTWVAPSLALAQQLAGCPIKWGHQAPRLEQVGENHWKLIGSADRPVIVDCDDTQLVADEIEMFTDTNLVFARGHVVYASGTNRIAADRMEFNTKTKTGTFYEASGTAHLGDRVDRSMFGTQEPYAYFYGAEIQKLGPKKFRITRGGFTTCVQPTPRWEMTSGSVTIVLEKHAILTNSILKVKGVPLMYLPAFYYPIQEDDRATGFLMPIYGTSLHRGQTLTNQFFWAINRSQDATLTHDWFTSTGQAYGGEYRYIASGASRGNANVYLTNVKGATFTSNGVATPTPAERSYTIRSSVTQALPAGTRLTANVDYFSSVTVQQLYTQDLYESSKRSRSWSAGTTSSWAGFTLSSAYNRSELFFDAENSYIEGSRPRVSLTRTSTRLGNAPVYVSGNLEFLNLQRQYVQTTDEETNISDLGLARFDSLGTVRVPFPTFSFMTVTSSLSWSGTRYSKSVDPDRGLVPEPIFRKYFTLAAELIGPSFVRIWNRPTSGYAARIKHLIEPRVEFSRLTGIDNVDRIQKYDSSDYRLGGSTEIRYGLTNRVLVKPAGDRAVSRNLLNVSIHQTYYTDPLTSQIDPTYGTSFLGRPPSAFSPISISTSLTPAAGSRVNARIEFDPIISALQSIWLGGEASSTNVFVNGSFSRRRLLPNSPTDASNNFLSAGTVLRTERNMLGGTYSFDYDFGRGVMVQQKIQGYYNAQCCGLIIEFQQANYPNFVNPLLIPQDRRFNISFSLGGIGTFSNFLGALAGQPTRR